MAAALLSIATASLCVLVAVLAPYQVGEPLKNPAVFADGVISTGDYESHPAFTPDGRMLYFVKSTPSFTDWKIHVSRYVDGRWSTPEVAPFSGKYRDADPFVTADGKRLYFTRTERESDVYVAEIHREH